MNKGLLLWTEVVCVRCSTTMAGEFVRHGRRQMRMVKAEMDKEGWTIVNGEAVCPLCQRVVKGFERDTSMDVELPTPMKGRQ